MTTRTSRRTVTRGDLGRFRPIVDGLEFRLAMAQIGLSAGLPAVAVASPTDAPGEDATPGIGSEVTGRGSLLSLLIGGGAATPGSSSEGSAGGSVAPAPVAAPSVPATVVQGIRLDAADPESAAATGLTIQLSGPIAMSALATTSAGAPVEVVDASGQDWTLTPTTYDATKGTLSFAFDRPLAAGTYTLAVSNATGWVDSEGRPVAATGQASGILGQFVEASSTRNPDDIGALAPQSAFSGLTSALPVAADGTASGQLVVLVPAFYEVSGVGDPRQVSLQAEDGTSRQVNLLPEPSGGLETFLVAGVYRLNLTGQDHSGGSATVTIRRKSNEDASLLGEGLGQASSQGTRLLASSTGSTTTNSAATGSDHASTSTSMDGAATTPVSIGQVIPGGGFLAIGTPVGRPSLQSDQISVVASSGSQGSIALASNGSTLASGLAPSLRNRRGEGILPEVLGTVPVLSGVGNAATPERAGASEAEEAPATIDPMGRLGRGLARAIEVLDALDMPAEIEAAGLDGSDASNPADRTDQDRPGAENPVIEMASFASPIGFIAASVVAIQYRRIRKAKRRQAIVPASIRSPLRGPHRPIRSARDVKTSIR